MTMLWLTGTFLAFVVGHALGRANADSSWIYSAEVGTSRCVRGRFFYVADEADTGQRKHMLAVLSIVDEQKRGKL